jgi:hypothetical protein
MGATMPAISLPLAQSKASRKSVGLWVIDRVPRTPSYSCHQTHIRRSSGAKLQGCLYRREPSVRVGMITPLVTPISYFPPQLYVQNDTPNHRFDFGNCAPALSLDREGEVPLWL